MTDKQRQAFEAHLLSLANDEASMGSDWPIWKNPDGTYVYSQGEWIAWQAAWTASRKLALEEAAESPSLQPGERQG